MLALLAFIAVTFLVPLLQKDVDEGVPWLAERLVRRAARRLPNGLGEDYEEDWVAEVQSVPGRFFKLWFAARIALRARSTGRADLGLPPFWEEVLLLIRRVGTTLIGRLQATLSRTWAIPGPESTSFEDGATHQGQGELDDAVAAFEGDSEVGQAALGEYLRDVLDDFSTPELLYFPGHGRADPGSEPRRSLPAHGLGGISTAEVVDSWTLETNRHVVLLSACSSGASPEQVHSAGDVDSAGRVRWGVR